MAVLISLKATGTDTLVQELLLKMDGNEASK